MAEEWVPVAADHGHLPVGRWQVLLTDTEVCTIWATDLDAHLRLMRSDDERIPAWRHRARSFTTRWREELMTPGRGTPLAGPPPTV